MKKDAIKKGPKGISLPNFALPIIIRKMPITAPMAKDKNSQRTRNCQFRKLSDKAKTSLTSPRPIPRPRVMMFRNKKKVAARKPANNTE